MNVALFLTLTVSSLAVAQAVPSIAGAASEETSKAAYRGTAVSYGHSMTVYQYTESERVWTHRMGITPEWHFNDAFGVRGRLYLTQELTQSNTTTHAYEVELSDVWLDGVWSGWKEPVTGIKLAADLRATLPTSKQSQFVTRLFTIAPGVNVSRTFNVLSGLTLIYSARFTGRVNRFPTQQIRVPRRIMCDVANDLSSCDSTDTGAANLVFDVLHGPVVSFTPHERVNVSAAFFMQRGWVPAFAATESGGQSFPARPAQTRDYMGFSLSVSYQAFDVVGFTLGTFTFANQLDSRSEYIFPLFNRNTMASLDATFDLEAIVSSVTKEKK